MNKLEEFPKGGCQYSEKRPLINAEEHKMNFSLKFIFSNSYSITKKSDN